MRLTLINRAQVFVQYQLQDMEIHGTTSATSNYGIDIHDDNLHLAAREKR